MANPGPQAQHWLAPARIIDGHTGQILSEAEALEHLRAARVIYVGEKHDRPQDHAIQLRLIDHLRQLDPSLGVGLEMVKRPFQKWLSDYVSGRIDEGKLLDKIEWKTRWGFDFALYRPIFEYLRQYSLPTYALNARDEITRTVAREGLEGLSEVDRETLPELNMNNEAHRTAVQAVFDEHGMSHGKMSFENFYTAQVIWDETMAHEVARELAAEGGPARMVVLVGSGHLRKGYGIPDRAARRGAEPYLSVYPCVVDEDPAELAELVKDQVADLLWVMLPPRLSP